MTEILTNCTILDPQDNVGIVLKDTESIPAGHKIALQQIMTGERIIKYGQVIAEATQDVPVGTHIHVHNARMIDFDRDYIYGSDVKNVEYTPLPSIPTFQGYRRSNGHVGTRNFIGIVTTVNCSATVAKLAAEELNRDITSTELANIDGILPIIHGSGCGMASNGDAFDMLQRTLW
ncbi:MAG: UxaA family hydrolase, partial [Sneathiella sp.]